MTFQQETFYHSAQKLGFDLSKAQLSAFRIYSQELIAWNRRANLTRIIEPEEIAVKHFLDSLSLYKVLAHLPPNFSMIDVGTGAGFPGLPLRIALVDIQVTLLEATAKKTKFIQHMVDLLELSDVTVLTARAEEAGHNPAHREQYDVAVARAVAILPVMAEYMLPFVKVGGISIAQKGQYPAEELETAPNALRTLGGEIKTIVPVEVTGLDSARHLIVIQKTTFTPKRYPRRPGVPAKKPLK